MSAHLIAVDLGATSGRVIRGHVSSDSINYEIVHRFPNGPISRDGRLHWDTGGLFHHILDGVKRASAGEPVHAMGVDSWAVDYGLIARGELLQEPFHYRDSRCRRGVDAVHASLSAEELFRLNGLQFLPFTSLYQLAAEDWGSGAAGAEHFLLIPDLMNYWLSGVMATELTNASTTGLIAVGSDSWSDDLIAVSGAPRKIFGDLVTPGTILGGVNTAAAEEIGEIPLVAVGSHDTASAVAATPLRSPHSAYLSLGTWGLVGLEVDRPILSDQAQRANFTNERGVDGSTRFLRNVMGLWMVNECVATWKTHEPGIRLDTLLAAVWQMTPALDLIDVDDPVFSPPGDMPSRIRQWLADRDRPVPDTPEGILNVVITSLAAAYATTVHEAGALAGQPVTEINVVGGGCNNSVLCQRIANAAGIPVIAGPVEATALGNLLVAAQAVGVVPPGVENIRHLVHRVATLQHYTPASRWGADN
jgi:rhamnulokinase